MIARRTRRGALAALGVLAAACSESGGGSLDAGASGVDRAAMLGDHPIAFAFNLVDARGQASASAECDEVLRAVIWLQRRAVVSLDLD